MINLFEARSVRWNDGVHAPFKKTFWEGVQESSQLKWLRKFLGVSEQKNFIFKPNSKKLEAVSFTAFFKLREFFGQNADYFNKANEHYSFIIFSYKKNCLKNI